MNIVSVMAHQDDELMCLGTMIKYKKMGHSLAFICLTDGSKGMVQNPEMSQKEAAQIRCNEMTDLCRRLGATYICLEEPDEFLYDTPQLRMKLINALRKVQAHVIFTHYRTDYNVDHMTTNLLVRQCAIQLPLPVLPTEYPPTPNTPAVFQVEPSGGFDFEPSHWVDISGEILEEKLSLAACHKSQDDAFIAAFGEGKGIANWISNASSKRGDQCGVAHAEAFIPMYARGLVKPGSILPEGL